MRWNQVVCTQLPIIWISGVVSGASVTNESSSCVFRHQNWLQVLERSWARHPQTSPSLSKPTSSLSLSLEAPPPPSLQPMPGRDPMNNRQWHLLLLLLNSTVWARARDGWTSKQVVRMKREQVQGPFVSCAWVLGWYLTVLTLYASN